MSGALPPSMTFLDLEGNVHPVDHALALLAQDQFGTFSCRQALRLGASRSLLHRRVASGRWLRFAEGSLGFPGWPPSFERSLWSGLHAAHPSAQVGPLSAAALYRMRGFARNRLEILVPHDARNRNPLLVVRQTRRMPQPVLVNGLPCPPLERTVCDVARFVGPRRLGAAVDDLLVSRRTTIARLQRTYLDLAVPAWPGYAVMAKVLAVRGEEYVPPRSDLERELDRVLSTIPGLPPRREVQIGDRVEMPHIVDRLYAPEKLIIEADGRPWHTRVADLVRDRRRDRRAAALGYTTFRYGHEELSGDVEEIRAEIKSFLGR